MMPHGLRRRAAGFSLLEAMVAVALIATTGLALLGWLNQSLDAANRLADRQRNQATLQEASRFVDALNPMESPSGELELGDLKLAWSSEPRTERVPNVSPSTAAPGDFELALYEVTVTTTSPSLPEPIVLRQIQLGWKRVRQTFTDQL